MKTRFGYIATLAMVMAVAIGGCNSELDGLVPDLTEDNGGASHCTDGEMRCYAPSDIHTLAKVEKCVGGEWKFAENCNAMQCVVMRRRQAVVLVLRMSTPVSMKIMASAK